MTNQPLRTVRRTALAALGLALLTAPASGQSNVVALTVGGGSGDASNGVYATLGQSSLSFRGSGSVDAQLRLSVYADGRLTETYVSRAFTLASGSTLAAAGLLPAAGWFDQHVPSEGPRGFFSWLSDLIWGAGTSSRPSQDVWAGYTEEMCREFSSYDVREACLASVRGRSQGGGVVVVAEPVAAGGSASRDVRMQGMVFVAGGS